MTPVYDYKIGAGYNLPAGSLTNIESITPSGDTAFYPPVSYGLFNPGDFKIRGDGKVYLSGFPSTQWIWTGNPGGRITQKQARYLQDTYAGGGYSGTVTIQTQTDNPGTYGRFNAVMILPKLPDAGKNFNVFQQYAVSFSRLEEL